MRRRRELAVLAFVLLIASAGAASGDGGPSPGAVTGWDGVLGARGAVRYVALPAGRLTTVAVVRVRDGRVLHYSAIPGGYGVPQVAWDGSTGGLSADGTTLVLASFGGPVYSKFAVVGTKTLRVRRVVSLRGSYSFDAISPDGRTMYLIRYRGLQTTTTYSVRAYDLAAGRLVPGAIVDRREPDEKMQGAPVTRASTRDGGWAYTLYSRLIGKAFVHALDTRHRRAFCVDLPWKVTQDTTVRMSVGGTRLVLRQPAIGRLAVIDTRTFRVTPLRKPVAPGTQVIGG